MRILGFEINDANTMRDLREANADLARIAEDVGWIKVNDRGEGSHEAAKASFDEMVKKSRLAFIKNPIVGQAINLTTTYVFGEGISEPKAKNENQEVQAIISEFWKHPDNKLSFTMAQAQLKISNKLQYDGELAICFKVDTDGQVYVRFVDPLSISQIVYDEYDGMRPAFYKRRVNFKDQYIPDYANGIAHLRDKYSQDWAALLKRLNIQDNQVPRNTFMYHVKINNDILDSRGVPEVYRALDWMNANSKINSDMALFINTQAQFAWKKKFKGTKAQMQAVRSRLGQNTSLTNPARGAGSTIIENEKVENEAIGLPNSSGELFETGIRRTLLMTVAAFGLMEHYFGDPSTGNLATTTVMELPMLKKFKSRQKVWEDIYLDVLNFVLDMRLFAISNKYFEYNPLTNRITPRKGADYADRYIDVDFPPILEKDIKMMAEALSSAKSGQLIPIETAQRMFLQAVGVNNIDEEMEKEFEEKIMPLLSAFGNEDPKAAQEGMRRLRDFLTRAKNRQRDARESAAPSPELLQKRQRAARLAEKNKEVFRKMNGYLKGIASEYRSMVDEVKENASVALGADEKWSGKIGNLDGIVSRFEKGMLRLAERYFPIAAELGKDYVESRLSIKEGKTVRLMEREDIDDFVDEQIEWNRRYVEDLGPAISSRFREKVSAKKFETKEAFYAAIDDAATAMQSRVGMYAGAFWTVEERAVQRAGRAENPEVNFIGVDDKDVCDGCREGLAGNPWKMQSVPVPGEQDCLGNCRHAIQLADDDPLQESDIQLMRDAEEEARRGFVLLTETQHATD